MWHINLAVIPNYTNIPFPASQVLSKVRHIIRNNKGNLYLKSTPTPRMLCLMHLQILQKQVVNYPTLLTIITITILETHFLSSCLLGFCLRDSLEIVVLRASAATISYLHMSQECAIGNWTVCLGNKTFGGVKVQFDKQSYLGARAYSPAGRARAPAPPHRAAAALIVPRLVLT